MVISRPFLACLFLATMVIPPGLACDREPLAPAAAPAVGSARVASLVPAVTNMLLELDQRTMLVAVSNYDTDPRVKDLPRVGDLLTIDWEQIAAARPTHMVVQTSRDKMPAGAIQRAEALGIELVHVRITRLEDIFETLSQLERALKGRYQDLRWSNGFRGALELAISPRPAEEAVPALVALSADLSFVAGRRNYLNDLLQNAGGVNVVPEEMADYPQLDRELLMSLRPRKVVLILPEATEGQLAEARRAVESMREAWGLDWNEDLTVITAAYAMVPGWSVVDVLRQMKEGLDAAE